MLDYNNAFRTYDGTLTKIQEIVSAYGISNISKTYLKETSYSLSKIIKVIETATDYENVELIEIEDTYICVFIKRLLKHSFITIIDISKLDKEYNFLQEKELKAKISLTVIGNLKTLENLDDIFINAKFSDFLNSPYITWKYMYEGAVVEKSSFISSKPIMDSFYPFVEQGVDAYVKSFLDSPQSVLILLGPPGTGKTSFLRHMICSNNLSAVTSFDDKVINSDVFYIDFILMDDNDILVIEDADLFLSSRKTEKNEIMFKFLNYSEGLVPLKNKKIIFTGNIDKEEIDSALMRPGRCYDVLKFRGLTVQEANKVYADLNKSGPVHKDVTLAEIFTSKKEDKFNHKLGF